MDKTYQDYKVKLEDFVRRNSKHFKSMPLGFTVESYLDYFKRKFEKEGKGFHSIGFANMYDDRLLAKYHDNIIYFGHYLFPENSRKFCGTLQISENLHFYLSYGCLGEDGFVTNLETYSTDPEDVLNFIEENKGIEFSKDYSNIGFMQKR